ncbi:hypothetical protein TrVE_jg4339 [Triparma verrucosa]|uniref:Uncharacterized protein n=1 Tax=Triparma verrucosa TaxID=1606542 RepID=A0A9W7FPP5_9STRA|nr:hypothetical protein TrVE_jg4339 [Triparma verrucosa]
MADKKDSNGANVGVNEAVADPTPNTDHHVGSPDKNQEGNGGETLGSPSSQNPEDVLPEEPSLARSSITKVEEEKVYRILPKAVRANVEVKWKKQGKVKKIKVKKRIQSVEERTQLKKQVDRLEAIKNANKPPPEVVNTNILDTRTPEEKLLAAKKKLKNIRGIKNAMNMSAMMKLKAGDGAEGEDDGGSSIATDDDNKVHLWDVMFGAKVKARSDAFSKALREAEEAAKRKPGVRDWPPWLKEFSKPRYVQARNARILDTQTVRANRDPDLEKEWKALKKKAKQHILPPLNYEAWAGHVPMPPDKRDWSVKPNLRKPGDYFRIDSIGWTKEDKYIFALRSPVVEKHVENVYQCIMNFLVPASKDGEKQLGLGEKVKVLELGSGSGQHAVTICERNRDTIHWQPTDVSDLCVDSINRRTKFYNVIKSSDPKTINGNCNEAFSFDILYYERNMSVEHGPLEQKWRAVDVMVAMNVIQYTPFRFVENMFRCANEVVKPFGTLFLYGPFRVEGVLSRDQEMADVNLRKLSAKFGIRDLEDVVAIAGEHMFQLELKFDLDGENIAVVFRKTPIKMMQADIEDADKAAKEGEDEGGDEEDKRKTRGSMRERLKSSMKNIRNIGSMFRKTGKGSSFFSKSKKKKVEEGEGGEGGGEGEEGGGEGGEGEGEGEGKGKGGRGERNSRMSVRKKNPRNRRKSKQSGGGGSDSDSGSDGTVDSKNREQRKSRASKAPRRRGSKQESVSEKRKSNNPKATREQQRQDRKSRIGGAKKGKEKISEKDAASKADALAEAAMSKFS